MDINEEYKKLRDRVIEGFFQGLNDEQLDAVLSGKDKVLVAACPGAGKTQVIINRVLYLNTFGATYRSGRVPEKLGWEDIIAVRGFLEDGAPRSSELPGVLTRESVKTENIVVLTFTRMAAGGMKDRYRKVTGKEEVPFFGTFHSLFFRILEKHSGRIRLVSETEAEAVIGRVLSDYSDSADEDKVRGVLNDISQHKNRVSLGLTYEPRTDREAFRDCLSRYEEFKAASGCMDYDDILIECIKLFERDCGLLGRYRDLFRHMLVDEFQDCDSQQIHMLKLLGSGSGIFAVGDEDQCIYGFRGSRPDCMVDFESHFEGGVKYFLNRNYRSRGNIIDSAKNLIGFNLCRNEKKMKAARRSQGDISLIPCSSPKDQADKAAEIINSLKAQEQLEETAVLYRTNRECGLLTASLLRRRINFKTLGETYNFLCESACLDMLAYFRLSADPSDRESFLRIVNRPNRYIGRTLAEKVRIFPSERSSFSLMAEQRGIGLDQARSILKLERQERRLKRMTPADAVDFVLRRIGYGEYIGKNEASRSVVEEFRGLAEGFGSIQEFLSFAEVYAAELEKAGGCGEGVALSTIHGSKGLEYRNVIIINCSEGNMPHERSFSDIEEERRIFYVGVTRAADNLWLLWPEVQKGKSCRRSVFVDEFQNIAKQ